MIAFRLPLGAPMFGAPPWKRQRPLGWVEVSLQGVQAGVWAPQMRRPRDCSRASTLASHSGSHLGDAGVPRAVVVGATAASDMVAPRGTGRTVRTCWTGRTMWSL